MYPIRVPDPPYTILKSTSMARRYDVSLRAPAAVKIELRAGSHSQLNSDPKTFCAKSLFIRPGSGATSREFSVDDYCWYTLHTVLLSLRRDIRLVHVEHLNVARWTGDALHELHRGFACGTSRAKDFYFSFLFHDYLPFTLS